MAKSGSIVKRMVGLSGLGVFLICLHAHSSFARPPDVVGVTIESERHVVPLDTVTKHIGLPLKLTFGVRPTGERKPIRISIHAGVVSAGAGLVVEHIAPDGTRSTQSLPPAPHWFSKAKTIEITTSGTLHTSFGALHTSFSVAVQPGMHLDFSKLGVYRISYVHPWADPERDPHGPIFKSNTLTIACVSQERYDQLSATMREDPELALASYCFKNPPSVRDVPPKYRREKYLDKIDETIKEGARRDEVLLLLGSPDGIYPAKKGEQDTDGWDEEWVYETSSVGGYYVRFRDACVVQKGTYADLAH